MGAEDVLHDLGVIAITSSDAQGMGRAGETVRRTFAVAGKMRGELGAAGRAAGAADNERVLRYLAKLTINPAIAHGLAHEIGSFEVGKLADLVLWNPAPSGPSRTWCSRRAFPAYGVDRRPERLHDPAEPLVYGPQFGGPGRRRRTCRWPSFSQAAATKRPVPVQSPPGGGVAAPGASARRRWCATAGSATCGSRPGPAWSPWTTSRCVPRPAESVPLSRLYFL